MSAFTVYIVGVLQCVITYTTCSVNTENILRISTRTVPEYQSWSNILVFGGACGAFVRPARVFCTHGRRLRRQHSSFGCDNFLVHCDCVKFFSAMHFLLSCDKEANQDSLDIADMFWSSHTSHHRIEELVSQACQGLTSKNPKLADFTHRSDSWEGIHWKTSWCRAQIKDDWKRCWTFPLSQRLPMSFSPMVSLHRPVLPQCASLPSQRHPLPEVL